MKFYQKETSLKPKERGYYVITNEVLSLIPEIENISIGQLQVFLKHTSASLTINENTDPNVLLDFENHFDSLVPEEMSYYLHNDENPDDLPAHLKSSILGSSVTIPITNGKLNMGKWQGIYFCEHRDYGGTRNLVLTAFGN